MFRKRKRILAVSSSGGHWAQLLRLRPAFEGYDVVFATTQNGSQNEVQGHSFYLLPESNRHSRFRLLLLALRILYVFARERPAIVVSTGAAPGVLCIGLGRLLGAKTIWLESIANAEKHSLSTELVRPYTDLLLTQWPHLACPDGPFYKGSVF